MTPWWTARKFWLGLACSGMFLCLVVQDVDWGRTAATVRQADWSLVCLGVGGVVATFVTLACRWRVLLASVAELPVQATFAYIMIGYLANAVLPLRLGEVARAVLLGRQRGIGASTTWLCWRSQSGSPISMRCWDTRLAPMA